MDLKDCYLAAGHEWVCLKPFFYWYLKGTLGIRNPIDYFISSQLLMNLKKIREDSFIRLFAEKIKSNQKFIAPDQDILNLVCGENICYLPPEWNVCWHWKDYISPRLLKKYRVYETGTNPPALIHYASDRKPWNSPEKELADLWWFYANKLPFKEKIQRKALEDRCRFLQKNYDMVVNSIPWKMTKPLRNFYDFLKFDLPEILKLLTGQRKGK